MYDIVLTHAVDSVQKHWKALRDKFAREIKKKKTKSGDSLDLTPTWELLDHMMFLKEFIKHRKYGTVGSVLPFV